MSVGERVIPTPSDARERATALDCRRSFIVQAPAGSGKTSLLVKRVLALLAEVEQPEEILALTFTRKAAGEMRERVIAALADAAAAGSKPAVVPSGPDARETRRLAVAALANDARRGWSILAQPQRLTLLTIDGLCARLAHRLPVTALLGAPIGIDDESDSRYREAALALLQSGEPSLDRLLLQVGNRLVAAADLLARMLATRDQWLRYRWDALEPAELRAVLTAMYERHVAARLDGFVGAISIAHRETLAAVESDAARFRRGLGLESEPLKADRSSRRSADDAVDEASDVGSPADGVLAVEVPGTAVTDIPRWQALVRSCLTAGGQLRKQVDRRSGFPTDKRDAAALGRSVAELKAHKARMLELLTAFDDGGRTEAVLNGILRLPSDGYSEDDWALLHELIAALPALRVELLERFREAGGLDFAEMALRARVALGPEDAPSDLALALDAGMRHLLVDEFQDTSQTQFELFEALVAGWEPDDGRTFFAVGDPMQSIYAFRKADVSLFQRAIDHGVGPVRLDALRLDANFRSAPAVVDWANAHFTGLFPARADPVRAAVPYVDSVPMLDEAGEVALHGLPEADPDREALHVLGLTREALAATTNGQVAILVRQRSHAGAIFRGLDAAGIDYASVDMDPLGERPVVRDLLSLALALRYPHDRLHWLAVLRAPWCGLELHDLHRLVAELPRHGALFERLDDARVLATLSEGGRRRVSRVHASLAMAVRRARRDPLVPWLEASWLALGGSAVCATAEDRAAVARALDALETLDATGRLRRASDYRAALDRLYAEPLDEGDARVQVMTMHRAKGLEYDTVILPGLARAGSRDEAPALDWIETSFDGEPQLLLAPIGERGGGRHAVGRLIADMRAARLEAELLRLLYVACTRAKRALHLVACLPAANRTGEVHPRSGSLLATLWPVCAARFLASADDVAGSSYAPAPDPRVGDDLSAAGVDRSDAVAPPSLRRLPLDWRPPVRDVYAWPGQTREPIEATEYPRFEWAGPLARDIGTVVHRQLQTLTTGEFSAVERDRVRTRAARQLRQLGVSTAELAVATTRVVDAVERSCSDPLGRWIFDASHREVRREWALSAVIDGRVHRIVVDRSFIDRDGSRWVVDFKTGDHTGGELDRFLDRELERYRDQLEHYVDIIGRLDSRSVRAGLYFPLLRAWRVLES